MVVKSDLLGVKGPCVVGPPWVVEVAFEIIEDSYC
jgi:hypothetical protein